MKITCFKESKNMALEKNSWGTIKFYKNNAFKLSLGIKTFIEANCTTNMRIGENVSCSVYTFEGCRAIFFQI